MEIIPAIDIIDGKCVRLTQGDYHRQKEYNSNPLEVAKEFEDAGISRLHLVDLDGAKAKRVVNLKVLETIASKTNLYIDFGGGIQSDSDIEKVFASGAKQVTGGSIAVRNPELFYHWLIKYGPERIILGADTKAGLIAISGWQETSEITVADLIRSFRNEGGEFVICTDVAKDGLLQGPSFQLYKGILKSFPALKLIASGGVSTVEDLQELQKSGVYGAIVGKAFYEGKLTLKDLVQFCS